jgi:hypothetical protein
MHQLMIALKTQLSIVLLLQAIQAIHHPHELR